jgi:hypothetical protein
MKRNLFTAVLLAVALPVVAFAQVPAAGDAKADAKTQAAAPASR